MHHVTFRTFVSFAKGVDVAKDVWLLDWILQYIIRIARYSASKDQNPVFQCTWLLAFYSYFVLIIDWISEICLHVLNVHPSYILDWTHSNLKSKLGFTKCSSDARLKNANRFQKFNQYLYWIEGPLYNRPQLSRTELICWTLYNLEFNMYAYVSYATSKIVFNVINCFMILLVLTARHYWFAEWACVSWPSKRWTRKLQSTILLLQWR